QPRAKSQILVRELVLLSRESSRKAYARATRIADFKHCLPHHFLLDAEIPLLHVAAVVSAEVGGGILADQGIETLRASGRFLQAGWIRIIHRVVGSKSAVERRHHGCV